MATLVLTTIGTAIGGPVGGMIGALVGRTADARLFGPKGREGPRLSDLRVQASSYGAVIPRLLGRMRVAGSVIWSTDLIEERVRDGGGKGRPATVSFRYRASFAVAISSGPIRAVHRIWADGNLLRGAAGDMKSSGIVRIHDGDADQPADPLIASAEGADGAPAYRGIAYVLFEDLDLSPFGNRIPSLTFEVDAGDCADIGDPLSELLDLRPAIATGHAIGGYAIGGGSRREQVVGLAELSAVGRVAGAGRRWGLPTEDTLLIGQPAQERGGAVAEQRRAPLRSIARAVHCDYFDPNRDFQTSRQTDTIPAGAGAEQVLALPASMSASQARRLARDMALRQLYRAGGISYPQGWHGLLAGPGQLVQTPAGLDSQRARVMRRRIRGSTITLELEAERHFPTSLRAADAGRNLAAPDLAAGESHAAIFDVPALDGIATSPRLMLAAVGSGPGWRGASVRLVPFAGASPQPLGTIKPAALLGLVTGASTDLAQADLFDRAGWIDVMFQHSAMEPAQASDADLLAGANLLMLGPELVQFGSAEPLGSGLWRLTHLLRGRGGTEDAMTLPMAGRPVARFDDPALMPVAANAVFSELPAGASLLLRGAGDAVDIEIPIGPNGRAMRPLSPCHLDLSWLAGGALHARWLPRAHAAFAWRDGGDDVPDPNSRRYRVTLVAGAAVQQTDCAEASLTIAPDILASWRADGATLLELSVQEIGSDRLSPAITASVVLTI